MNFMRRILGIGMGVAFLAQSAVAADVRIKNFRELPLSLEAVTGTSYKGTEIRSFHQARATQFPQYGQLSELGSTFLMAELSYSALFCEAMVVKDSKLSPDKRYAHKNIDFTKGHKQLTSSLQQELIEDYAGMFWGRSLDADEVTILNQLVDDLKAEHPDTAESLRVILIQVCAVYGSSFDFLLQ